MLNVAASPAERSGPVIPLNATALLFLGTIAFCITEIVIGAKYTDDSSNDCHNGPLLKPTVWMLWDGITGLIVLGAFLVVMTNRHSQTWTFAPLVYNIAGLIVLLSVAFAIAWAVIGGVVLWRDNDPMCGPEQLHDAMWACVIIDVVLMGFTVLTLL